MSTRILIVEDEQNIQNLIKVMLNSIDPSFEIEIADSVKLAEQKYMEFSPEILLLDVQLKDGISFEFLNTIKNKLNEERIIFITSYNHYAIKAIKFNAFDYIVKPIDPEEFSDTIQRALGEKSAHTTKQVINLIQSKEKNDNRILLSTMEKAYLVDLKDLIYAKADGNYTQFFVKDVDSKILISKKFGYYLDVLQGESFVQVHRSYLINTKHIKEVDKSRHEIIASDNHRVPYTISYSQLKDLMLNT